MTILQDVIAYLGSVGVPAGRYSDAVLNKAIATETAAQTHKCTATGTDGTNMQLNEALCRRVQVNLARRALPLGIVEASGDGDSRSFLPRIDPEIMRLEAPYRKLVCG